jgi:hypothetical protein
MQELFACLCQNNFSSQSAQKATANIALQSLHGVAYARLRKVKLTCGLRETARAGQHGKGA